MSRKRKWLDGLQLYHFATCPFCVKVRTALWWMGLEVPLRDIYAEPGNLAELVAGGGKPQVPCLRIEEAGGGVRWLYESSDIIQYLKQFTDQ